MYHLENWGAGSFHPSKCSTGKENIRIQVGHRGVAQVVERRSPKP